MPRRPLERRATKKDLWKIAIALSDPNCVCGNPYGDVCVWHHAAGRLDTFIKNEQRYETARQGKMGGGDNQVTGKSDRVKP